MAVVDEPLAFANTSPIYLSLSNQNQLQLQVSHKPKSPRAMPNVTVRPLPVKFTEGG
jgi:hypothetical protein